MLKDNQRKYFENIAGYIIPKLNTLFEDSKQDINYLSIKVRSIAKNALNETLSPNQAKKEISNLITTINKLNSEQSTN